MMDQLLTLGIKGFESSEELLGAYLEDSLPIIDSLKVKQFIKEHTDLNNFINDISSTKIELGTCPDELLLETLDLPTIEEFKDITTNEHINNLHNKRKNLK